MCFGGSPKQPAPAPVVAPPAPIDTTGKDKQLKEVQNAKLKEQQRAASAVGRSDTILTGALGATGDATTKKKTLLGE
jgi:hypothetical protein